MKKTALALLTIALLAMPLIYVACPESHAADGSTPWPGLYVGQRYTFYGSGGQSVGCYVIGHDGEYIIGGTLDMTQENTYVNMYNVMAYRIVAGE